MPVADPPDRSELDTSWKAIIVLALGYVTLAGAILFATIVISPETDV
jgi:hypothetical protein